MFIDEEWKKDETLDKVFVPPPPKIKSIIAPAILIPFSLVFVFVIGWSLFFMFVWEPDPVNFVVSTSTPKFIVGNKLPDNDGEAGGIMRDDDLKAEKILFGQFYSENRDVIKTDLSGYALPVNIKEEAANFYDISRKIDLSDVTDDLNKHGFAIIDNLLGNKSDDMLESYSDLVSSGVPMFVTSDFLIYYYQNNLKQIFKDIEKNVFYDGLWHIAKTMYDEAAIRYRIHYNEVGIINDPSLEGERMVVSYWAVLLETLKPQSRQIDARESFFDSSKFTLEDSKKYDYRLLDVIKDDVKDELAMIRVASGKKRSGVLLYDRDYGDFIVDGEYRQDAKLNNFYLATKWLNSLFPLNYQDDECQGCLLDKEDWLVSLTAANLLAQDMSNNQKIKNEWAAIYKSLAFFKNVQEEITYLHINKAFREIFGSRKVEDVFNRQNINLNRDVNAWQEKLLTYEFDPSIGAYDRSYLKDKKNIGLRILQNNYSPDNFLFSTLTGTNLVYPASPENVGNLITYCVNRDTKEVYRCRANGEDIINLFSPLKTQVFLENSKYAGYNDRVSYLQEYIGRFNVNTWHSSFYWSTLDFTKNMLATNRDFFPVFMQSDKWMAEKEVNTAVSAWANIHLPLDKFSTRTSDNRLWSESRECSLYNYIEPNIDLVNDMLSNINMLVDFFTNIGISDQINLVLVELQDVKSNLDFVKSVVMKEIDNESIDIKDCEKMEEFLTQYMVVDHGKNSFTNYFFNQKIVETLARPKFLVVLRQNNGEKVINVGAVFNHYATK